MRIKYLIIIYSLYVKVFSKTSARRIIQNSLKILLRILKRIYLKHHCQQITLTKNYSSHLKFKSSIDQQVYYLNLYLLYWIINIKVITPIKVMMLTLFQIKINEEFPNFAVN